MFGFLRQKPPVAEESDLDFELANVTIPEPEDICKMCHPTNDFARGYCDWHRDQREQEIENMFNYGTPRRRR